MDSNRKWTTMVAIGIGVGSLLITGRSLARFVGKWRLSRQSEAFHNALVERLKDPLPSTTIVTRNVEWERVYIELRKDCAVVPILGFDCEWVNLDGKVQPVALIQIASHSGRCTLVRLSSMSSIPDSLKALMADPGILKVGVATWEDANKLKKDHGLHVRGVFDVRRLIHKHPLRETLRAKSGLSGLSEQLLDVKLSKHFSIRCSDWEAESLTITQIKYASQDALASLAVCLKLVSDTLTHENNMWSFNLESFYSSWARTARWLDTKFHMSYSSSNSNNNKSLLNGTASRGKLATSSKPKNSRAYSARKSALYDNCILQAPDGQQLCTCDTKKALWYVNKGRGELISESPVMTVRLTFEPSGRPSSEYDLYYLRDKANACVVCGRQETFLRKNIVPHEYRKHFPAFFKDHKSHDVLLLCLDCHAECNAHENDLRSQLAEECEAPVGTERDVKMKLDKRLGEVQKAANALLTSRHLMPVERVAYLESKVIEYFELQETEKPSQDILERAQNLEIRIPNADYVPHGLKVVRHFEEKHSKQEGLLVLERLWREHFLRTMKPKHLPDLWSVDHNRKPEEKWSATTPIIISS